MTARRCAKKLKRDSSTLRDEMGGDLITSYRRYQTKEYPRYRVNDVEVVKKRDFSTIGGRVAVSFWICLSLYYSVRRIFWLLVGSLQATDTTLGA